MSNALQTFRRSTVGKTGSGSKEKRMFSFGSALGVTLLLTVFLWWLPVLGQMIAGYVGGRKSGSVLKGIAATFTAVFSFIVIAMILSAFGLSIVDGQKAVLDTVAGGFPAFADMTTSMSAYLEGFFAQYGELTATVGVIAVVTVMFGAIGGIMSSQVAKESQYRSPSVSSAHANARSMNAYRSGRSSGFGSFDDYLPVNAVQSVRSDVAAKKPLVRKASARDVPEKAVQEPELEYSSSPLSSVLTMSDRTPVKEKQIQPKDDFEYI